MFPNDGNQEFAKSRGLTPQEGALCMVGSLTKDHMSTVIKGGTVVTADLSYEADVLVENGVITEIGPGLKGDEVLDATGCYVMPGGIDPHVHLEMPFMGTYSSDDFESPARARASLAARPWSSTSACRTRARGCMTR
jgi:cytosine/adenosine deaminase-related metal-dependent hydrolase